MSLANLLSAEQIIPEMKATERWAAIVELIDLLVRLGKIKPQDRDPILAALRQREETMRQESDSGSRFHIVRPTGSMKSSPRSGDPQLASSLMRSIMLR